MLRKPAERAERTARRIEVALAAVGVLVLAGMGIAVLFDLGGKAPAAGAIAAGPGAFRPSVADMRGGVEYRPAGTLAWRALEWSDVFSAGDALRVGAGGAYCDILLTWGAGMRVLASTELVWTRLQASGTGPAREVELKLQSGRVLAALDRLPPGSRFEVVTSRCRARVKGTILGVEASAQATGVSTLEGIVAVIDEVDPTIRVETVAGTVVQIGNDGKIPAPRPLSAEERAALVADVEALKGSLDRVSPGAAPRPPAPVAGATAAPAPPSPEGAEEEAPVEDLPAEAGALTAIFEKAAAARRPAPKKAGTEGAPVLDVGGDEARVREVLERGVALLDQGRIPEALDLATQTFRALIQGAAAKGSTAAAVTEVSRADAMVLARRLVETVSVRITVGSIDVVIDREQAVAYGSGVVEVKATKTGSRKVRVRRYSCLARCVPSERGWLVDLAVAMPGDDGEEERDGAEDGKDGGEEQGPADAAGDGGNG